MLQRRRSVGVSPEYWLIIPRAAACGTGIVRVMGLWNLRRRGSTVTIGETATRLPSSFTTNSGWIGCACRSTTKNHFTSSLRAFFASCWVISMSLQNSISNSSPTQNTTRNKKKEAKHKKEKRWAMLKLKRSRGENSQPFSSRNSSKTVE